LILELKRPALTPFFAINSTVRLKISGKTFGNSLIIVRLTISFDKPKGEGYYDKNVPQQTLYEYLETLDPILQFCPSGSPFYLCPQLRNEQIETA
jgi:hypothetical protein